MPEHQLFEYAVIRLVPRVEREEFLNIGVILLCRQQKFLEIRYELSETRIKAISDEVDFQEIGEYLNAFEKICKGGPNGGPIGQLTIAERFRWLTAARSTLIQTSAVHPGLCINAKESLARLFEQLVL